MSSCPGIGASSTSGPVRRPDKLHCTSDPATVFTGCLAGNVAFHFLFHGFSSAMASRSLCTITNADF
jgi:hypothetical protein